MRGPADAIDTHIADSLAGLEAPALAGAQAIADLGSGAGFPGLPLAVALPAARVDLIESTRRKAEVIKRLAAAAGLENARIICARVEERAVGESRGAYDAVTARALARLPVLLEYAAPLLRTGGALVAWKGAGDPDEERAGEDAARTLGMSPAGRLRVVPFEGARRRHLHVFVKREPTPERFPRRPGMARKRPLA